MNINEKCLLVVCVIVGVWLIHEFYKDIYEKSLRHEEFKTEAEVVRKKYRNKYVTLIPIVTSKSMVFASNFHDEEFNVYLIYKDCEYCFNDEDMFNSLKVGDKTNVVVHEWYNKEGKSEKTKLTIDK